MQKTDNPVQSLGICQRIFNFLANSLIPCGLKRIISGPAVPEGSTKVPVDDDRLRNGVGSLSEQKPVSFGLAKPTGEGKVEHQAEGKPKDDSGHEIQIHFKQSEEDLECWTPIDALGSSVHEAKKYSLSFDGEKAKLRKGHENIPVPPVATAPLSGQKPDDKATKKRGKVMEPHRNKEEPPLVQVTGGTSLSQVSKRVDDSSQHKGSQDAATPGKSSRAIEPNLKIVAQGRGPKKVVSMQDPAEDDKAKKKGKNIAISSEKMAPPVEQKEPEVRFPVHLISVTSNINEKSAAFIENQKAEMKRKFSLELKKP